MSLLDAFSKEFVMIDKTSVPDGDGGFIPTYKEGLKFKMPQAHDTTIEAQQAEREGTASTYTFLPAKGMQFSYHDIFKRVSDGQYFRVTVPVGDKETPELSRLGLTYIKAEKWEMTT